MTITRFDGSDFDSNQTVCLWYTEVLRCAWQHHAFLPTFMLMALLSCIELV